MMSGSASPQPSFPASQSATVPSSAHTRSSRKTCRRVRSSSAFPRTSSNIVRGMMENTAPQPTVMPVDREAWRKEIHLSNFVNAGYQYRDLQSCGADVRKVLIIGPGQGLDTHVLRWLGYDVTTFDIDETFSPDHIGSVHQMTLFSDRQFDAVIASHVLEHLAVPYLDAALAELARVGRFALVYLPVAGR